MKVVVVVPCFNEANRLVPREFLDLVEGHGEVAVMFVDDGSTDSTAEVLRGLASHGRISVLTLERNVGKAEAVRQGMLKASAGDADWIGYVDADLATPVVEIVRLVEIATNGSDLACVFGSRVRLCGNQVNRRLSRHIVGRVFATLADRVLGAHVYDSQAGAKFFRNSSGFRGCLGVPFVDRWSFDVELFGRLGTIGVFPQRTLEVPLRVWVDQDGSKVSVLAGARALLSLVRVRRRLRNFHPPQ